MLSGSSFRLAFVLSISLILFGFPLIFFHLAEASLYDLPWFYTLVSVVVKNITKCFLFIIIHIFSTHFAIDLFYLHLKE